MEDLVNTKEAPKCAENGFQNDQNQIYDRNCSSQQCQHGRTHAQFRSEFHFRRSNQGFTRPRVMRILRVLFVLLPWSFPVIFAIYVGITATRYELKLIKARNVCPVSPNILAEKLRDFFNKLF